MTYKDPVCGMDVNTDCDYTAEYSGQTYYFCSAGCRDKFKADPGQYVQPKEKLKDPVCGMDVTADSEYTAEYDGQTYFFCSAGCRDKFKENPEQYTQKKK